MYKIMIKIDGMACGMCESHVNNAVRTAFRVKKVESSHGRGETVIITEKTIAEKELTAAIENMGYKVLDIKTEPYEKKGFGFFKR